MTKIYNAPPGFEMNPNGMAAKCQALIKGAEHDKRANDEEIAELKESYALLFKAHAAERARWEDTTSMDCASCEYVAPTRHDECKGCERAVTVHANYKRASWA